MWFNINAWGRQAEICNQYLTRGRQVYIEGTLTTRIFTGNDGQPRVSNDVRMTEMQMLGGPRDGGMDEERAPYAGDMGRGGMEDYNNSGGMGGGRGMGGGYGNQPDDIDDLPF